MTETRTFHFLSELLVQWVHSCIFKSNKHLDIMFYYLKIYCNVFCLFIAVLLICDIFDPETIFVCGSVIRLRAFYSILDIKNIFIVENIALRIVVIFFCVAES